MLLSKISSQGDVEGKVVRIEPVEPFDVAFHAALSLTLDEWTRKEDEQAFHDLPSRPTPPNE